MNQIFASGRIRFVEVTEALVPDYLVMVNDYERVGRLIGPRREPYTEEKERRWVREKLEERTFVFSMLDKESGAFIGNIELMDPADGEAELGVAVTGDMQDRGYGTEAVAALVNYGFGTLGLRRITLKTYLSNARAIRVYEKCGFCEYGRTDDQLLMELRRDGGRIDG